jgi:hypothetical protein
MTWEPMNPALPVIKMFIGLPPVMASAVCAGLAGCWWFGFGRLAFMD